MLKCTQLHIENKKDTKNSITWWCLTAPTRPRIDININSIPHASIPPTIGKLVTIDAARPYTPTPIKRKPTTFCMIIGFKNSKSIAQRIVCGRSNGCICMYPIILYTTLTIYKMFKAINAFLEHENPPHMMLNLNNYLVFYMFYSQTKTISINSAKHFPFEWLF